MEKRDKTAKQILKSDFKKILITTKDLKFIDAFCKSRGYPCGKGFKVGFAIFLNEYKRQK